MAKLVIRKDELVIDERELDGQVLEIGRDPHSDLRLNDPAVSRHHARVQKILNDYYLEDLQSTNGTLLNSRPVIKHVLKDGDRIHIGGFDIVFADPKVDAVAEEDLDKTVIIQVPKGGKGVNEAREQPSMRRITPKTAMLRFFRGPNKGQSERIDRSLYTIGRPGSEVAVIARRPQGFYLLHIGGDRYPRINNKEINTTAGVQLSEGDVLEVGENLVEISFV